jgi:hypothetical protein
MRKICRVTFGPPFRSNRNMSAIRINGCVRELRLVECMGSASEALRSRDKCEFRLEQRTAKPGLAANGFQGRGRYVDIGCGDLLSVLP